MRKSYFLRPFGLVVLAALLWLLAALTLPATQPATATQAEAARVEVRVRAALQEAARAASLALVRVRAAGAEPFTQAGDAEAESAALVTFVFHRDSLVWWSHNGLLIDLDNASGTSRFRMVESKQGKMLIASAMQGSGWRALTYVPLEKHYTISNRYLIPHLNATIFGALRPGLVFDERAALPRIHASDGTYLFSLAPNPDAAGAGLLTVRHTWPPLLLLLLGIVAYISGWAGLAQALRQRGRPVWGAGLLLGALGTLRAALLFGNLPFALLDVPLFDPRYYAASWLAPSLGDQLLNVALLAVALVYAVRAGQVLSPLVRVWIKHLPDGTRAALVAVGVGGLAGLLALRYRVYGDTFINSQLDLDVTQSVHFTWLKATLALLLVLHSAAASVGLLALTRTISRLLPPAARRPAWQAMLVGEFALWGAAFWFGSYYLALGALALLFAKGVLVVQERERRRGLPYPATVFMFGAVMLWALVGALAQKRQYDRNLRVAEQKLAERLLLEHDVLGEFLLEEAATQMAADPLMRRTLTGAFSQPDIARQKVEKYYLRDYFAQYETGIRFFDAAGHEFGTARLDTTRGLAQYRRRMLRGARPTEHADLWLLADAHELTTRRYVKLVRVPDPADPTAPAPVIALELLLKKLNPYSVVPELLVDQKYAPATSALGRPFSYATFGPDGLIAAEGPFDYSTWRPGAPIFQDARLYTPEGISTEGIHHTALRYGQMGQLLIISAPAYTATDVLANFSFLFLLHLVLGMTALTVLTLWRGRQQSGRRAQASFSTKIQVLLNLGALVPLLVVSISTVAVSTRAYRQELVTTYQQRGERVQQNLVRAGRVTTARTLGRDELAGLVRDVADLAETDVLLYDARGQLLVSSQPLLFETGALSKLLNPAAVAALRERGQPRALLPEQAGALTFNALYLPLTAGPPGTPEARRLTGFIGIPFFDSAQALDVKITSLAATMMSLFTLMFIVITFITFLAARSLTRPLKLLANKLNQTTLTGQNERLAYEAPDEIGLLVREYNQMLTALEASRHELATRSREDAWREMARQVAHEIKNPLTPMKLSLQYLQRAIRDGRADVEALIAKVSETLITQIDTLADIATSFSSFVSLPEPKFERLELLALLRHCLDLHPGTADVRVESQAPEVWVRADKNLLVRTFNNLLLNALQAVPEGREPLIRATVAAEGSAAVCVGIHDNGAGIPAHVQPKVFVPNFSTKFSGSGIGLAVAKRAVEGAGGRLWFETTAGEGTSFYLTLPVPA